jgi:hypothetical protein
MVALCWPGKDARPVLVRLGAVIGAWVIWAWKPSLGWVLALAVAPWAIQTLTRRLTLQRTFLDIPLALFLLTAGIGLWASYDQDGSWAIFSHPIGWQKLWGLFLAALLYYAVATSKTPVARCWAAGALAGLGALVAAVFIATHDWTAEPAKWEPIGQLGKMIQVFLPSLPGDILNPNVSAGIMAPLLPLSLGLVARARGRERENAQLWVVWGLTTGCVMTLGLVLTASRGAWAGLGGGTILAVTWWLAGKQGQGKRRLAVWAALTLLEGLAGGLVLVLVPTLRAAILNSYTVTNRLSVFSQAALLVRDYPFTGCGLGNFALVHSTYVLLIHVPILSHAHALLLNVAVEQGVFGALAVVVMWIGAGWLGLKELAQVKEPRPMLTAALLSLVVLITHGLVDDALYSSRGVLLLWAPAGAIVAALPRDKSERSLLPRWLALALVATFSLGLAILLAGRTLAAAWNANLGAVAQTKVELQAYDYKHFDQPTLDQIRQGKDLSVAEGYFARALAFNPGQATARTRQAAIALSRGQYGQALLHAQTAWNVGYRDRVTRLLLSDALVATGQAERAAEIVRGLAWAEERLEGQAWYRYWVNGDYGRSADAWRVVAALNPQNESVVNWITMAEERLETP